MFRKILAGLACAAMILITAAQTPPQKAMDKIPESDWSLVRELQSVKIADFSVQDLPLEETMKKLFAMLPRDVKYIRGYKIQNEGQSDIVTVTVRDIELGVLISFIASSAKMGIHEKSGILEFMPYGSQRKIFSFLIKDEVARKFGFAGEKGDTVDVLDYLNKFKIYAGSAKYIPSKNILYGHFRDDERAVLSSAITFMERGVDLVVR